MYTSARDADNEAKKKKKKEWQFSKGGSMSRGSNHPLHPLSSFSINFSFLDPPFIKSFVLFLFLSFRRVCHPPNIESFNSDEGRNDGSAREKRFFEFEELFIIIRKYIKYFMDGMDLSFELGLSKVIRKERETKMTEEKRRKYRIKNVNRRKIERHC